MIERVLSSGRNLCLAAAMLGAATALGACTHTTQEVVNKYIPDDYRQRHPIVVQEANQAVEIFIGSGRGGLSASQRADVRGLAQSWLHEGTGAITIDVPIHTPNARAAADSRREIQAIFSAAGIPSKGVTVRNYRPADPRQFATIRLNYSRIMADAGPCGLWPEDLGLSIKNKNYLENRQYHNFGCANQRNLAAMIDNPSDLVQPRTETPAYTERRNITFDQYRKSNTTGSSDKAKLSDIAK
jgi:pilus assembly protein CpaD